MRLSRFTLFVDDFPKSGQHVAFSTLTLAQVVVDSQLRQILEALPAPTASEEANGALKHLEGLGLVVSDEVDEDEVLDKWFEQVKNESSRLNVVLLTTYDCNFRCVYCYEEDVKKAANMDEKTAIQAVEYIRGRVIAQQPESVHIDFYGGEPLMNMKALRIVAGGVQTLAREMKFSLSMGMSTNGSLLTPRVVDELTYYGLKQAKIVLDGTKEYHDKKRPFRNKKGSYDRIMRNLEYAVDKMTIDIGGNFDDENRQGITELLEHLKSLGYAGKVRRVVIKPIMETLIDRERRPANADIGCTLQSRKVQESMVELRRTVLEKGFRADPSIAFNLCSMVMNPSTLCIDPFGNIYRCPGLVGHKKFAVGSIDEPGREDFTSKELWKRCRDCVYVPVCGDGCTYSSYTRFGDPGKLNCQKELLEYAIPENIKMSYLHAKQKRGASA